MAPKLSLHYDREGDILYISKCPPYAAQDSEEIGDDVVVRLNPQTGEVENLEVLFFTARLGSGDTIEVPLDAELRLPKDG
ncbi:MAG: DUF2283 domain-containing protein [Candidatus Eisenbacteria bacterium]|nr:DUF2283 domain-containing protein [Candidatus Eisenbacteria bacterium]